jgi:hypothetical protein
VNPADAQLIEQIRQTTRGASRALVTLARRGKAIERDNPERATSLVAAVANHPLYKGGRLTFDMLEIEDLMLDDSPVDLMSIPELIRILNAGGHHLAETLRRMGSPAEDGRMQDGANPTTELLGSLARTGAQSADESTAGILPRVTLGPADHMELTANVSAPRNVDGRTGSNEPELKSSDYLYDYVVLGLLDVVGGMRMFPS